MLENNSSFIHHKNPLASFIKKCSPIIVLITLIITISYTSLFFGIPIGNYIGYIIWFIALLILYYILPSNKNTAFIDY